MSVKHASPQTPRISLTNEKPVFIFSSHALHVKVKISNGQLQRQNKDILSFGYVQLRKA